MYTINVIVITYNQEKYIGRALDSILCQKDYGLKNIIVVDDCSTDGNWRELSKYAEKYPTIVKAYRNEQNLGIMANIEKSAKLKGDADLYCRCSGDDALCDGWFKAIQDYLAKEDVDIQDSFFILGDYKTIQPDGKECVFSQRKLLKQHVPLKMKFLRGVIPGRSSILSKKLFDSYEPVIYNKGLNLSETHYDIQKYLHANNYYYIPYVGSIYYMRIGVARSLSLIKEKYDSYWLDGNIVKWEYMKENVLTRSIDKNYANYYINRCLYEKTGKKRFLIRALWYRLVSIDIWVDRLIPVLLDFYHICVAHRRYEEKFLSNNAR